MFSRSIAWSNYMKYVKFENCFTGFWLPTILEEAAQLAIRPFIRTFSTFSIHCYFCREVVFWDPELAS